MTELRRLQALILYEHLLTLEQERRAIWARPWSIPTVLFLLNRYLLLLYGLALYLWGFVTWETDSVSMMARQVVEDQITV